MSESKTRRRDVDLARAVAIVAVVLHHVPQYFAAYGLDHFDAALGRTMMHAANFIHIPVFMLLAGIVLRIGRRRIRTLGDYRRFELPKLCRLMLPFLVISLLHLLIKLVAPGRGAGGIPGSLAHTFVAPRGGLAGHLWFLYCLMSIFLLWPLLGRLPSGRAMPALLAGLMALAVLPIGWPMDGCSPPHPLGGLADVAWYLPIFALGYWHGRGGDGPPARRPGAIILAGAVFLASLLGHLLPDWPAGAGWKLLHNAVRLSGNIAAAFFVLWVCGVVAGWRNRFGRGMETVGLYSYDIYLLHVGLVGHPLVFFFSRLRPGLWLTYVLAAVAAGAMLTVALAIGRLIRRFPPAAFVVLGVPMRKPAAPPAGQPRRI